MNTLDIVEKAKNGERISDAEALHLFEKADLVATASSARSTARRAIRRSTCSRTNSSAKRSWRSVLREYHGRPDLFRYARRIDEPALHNRSYLVQVDDARRLLH